MDDGLELLKKRLIELSRRASERGCCLSSGFLSLGEQSALISLSAALASPYALYGGAEGCERKIAGFGAIFGEGDARFCAPGQGEAAFPIACLEILPKSKKFAGELSHRDFLGSLMRLGVERDRIGDIIVRDSAAYVFVESSLAAFFEGELERVGRASVSCRRADAPSEGKLFELRAESLRVSSARADALIARAYNLSRQEAAELFDADRVFINGLSAKGPNAAPKEGDIVSVRGYGRFLFRGEQGVSKKGKLIIGIEKYI